jgi:hypothetical protein
MTAEGDNGVLMQKVVKERLALLQQVWKSNGTGPEADIEPKVLERKKKHAPTLDVNSLEDLLVVFQQREIGLFQEASIVVIVVLFSLTILVSSMLERLNLSSQQLGSSMHAKNEHGKKLFSMSGCNTKMPSPLANGCPLNRHCI